jgi:signal transduction histidine kinase
MTEGFAELPERDFSERVEQLLQGGRRSEPLRPDQREIATEGAVGGAFLATAIALCALLPAEDSFSLALAAVFAVAYAALTRIQFEIGAGYTVPTQLLFVPMLFALPPRTVPLVVALGLLLGDLPDYFRGRRHVLRAMQALGDSWYSIGPAVILAATGAEDPAWRDWPIYLAALVAQLAIDFAASAVREWLRRGVGLRVQLGVYGWVSLVDVLLSPVGLLAAFGSAKGRYGFLLLLPLAGVFVVFARERRARIENALGLTQAYREKAELNTRLLETERAASRSREQLIAGASHEMQTPLAVLIGLLDATSRGEVPPERQPELFASMRRQATRLRHLVRQFIDYTRLKSGRPLRIDPRPSDVKPIVEEVADAQRGYGQVELDLPEDLPQALVDPESLHQMLMSLVSNAIKFSPEGSATTIAVRSHATSIEISVTDRGAGIASDDLRQLFDEIPRSKSGNEDPGTGLGLYMVHMLSELQGADVTVDSKPGEGSCFTIALPRAPRV